MANHKLRWTLCSAVVVALVTAALVQHAGASPNVQRTTYLTFSQPVRLPGVALGAGSYIFEMAAPEGTTDIVRVLSRDRTHAYFMGFTRSISRPSGMPGTQAVTLGEASVGALPPVNVWWLQGESSGRQFIYDQNR